MPRDLAALLLEDGAVPADALSRALDRQREVGGALDTALLEDGLLGEEALVAYLARAAELPAAPPEAWVASDARARRVFPSRVAERHGLAPFTLEGRELALVATYPVDLALLDEISFMLSLHLAPHVAPEWRVRELIHRLYGGALAPRLAALAAAAGSPVAPAPALEEDAVEGAPPPAPPPTGFADGEGLEPLAAALQQAIDATEPPAEAPAPERAPQAEAPAAGPAHEEAEREPGEEEPAGDRPPLDRSAPPRWSIDDARAALAAARDRDEVVLVALRYARDFFEYAAMFAVTRDAVAGHDAIGLEDERERARTVAIWASDPGIFKTVIETRSPFLGPVSRDAPGTETILSGLGREAPRTVLVHPVLLRDRAVCVLYADNGEAPVSPRRLGDLLLFLSGLGAAFERIIRRRKKGRPQGEAAPPAPAVAEQERAAEAEPRDSAAEPAATGPVRAIEPEAAPELEAAPEREPDVEPSPGALPEVDAGRAPEARRPDVPRPAPGADEGEPPGRGGVPAGQEASAAGPGTSTFAAAPPDAGAQAPAEPEGTAISWPVPEPEPPADAEPPALSWPEPEPGPRAGEPPSWSDVEAAAARREPSAPAASEPGPPLGGAEERAAAPGSAPARESASAMEEALAAIDVDVDVDFDAEPKDPAQAEPPASAGARPPAPDAAPLRPGDAAPDAAAAGVPPAAPSLDALEEAFFSGGPPAAPEPSRAAPDWPPPWEPTPSQPIAAAGPDPGAASAALDAAPGDPAPGAPASAPVAVETPGRAEAELQPHRAPDPPADLHEPLPAAPSQTPAPLRTPVPVAPASPAALADRALDADPGVADAAREALAAQRRDPALRPANEKLRRALLSGISGRTARAARAIGALRDVEAIPLLIQVLETSEPETATAAAEALALITLQRLGPDARRWLGWWKENRGRGRAEWLFSGLTSADRETRLAAAAELSLAAPPPVAYSADLPPGELQRLAREWAGWWARSGHVL